MKKILFLTLEYPPTAGGIATVADNLAAALGDVSIVLATPASGAEEFDASRPYTVVRRPLLFPRFFWPRWLRALFAVLGITGREPVGMVVVHHVLPLGYVALLLKWFWKIPYAVWYHGTDVHVATAHWGKRLLLSLVSSRAEINIFDSEYLRKKFITALPRLKEKTLVTPPCPDPLFFAPADPDAVNRIRSQYALHGKQVLLSVGRLVDGKGFPLLLRLLPEIMKAVPNLVWVVAGDGPKRDLLAKLASEMGIQHQVRLAGNVPHEDLPAFYHAADVFALLTHPDEGREEGFGLVFLEAAASGLSVVAGRSGGVVEAVLDKETGLVVDARIDKQVIDACTMLFTDREEAKRLAANAELRVKTDFQWGKRIEQLKPWLSL